MNKLKIHCDEIVEVDVNELKPNPKNPNKHSEEQIERLAKILQYQGFRYPIKVSNLSGYITSGHGRLEAAKKLGLSKVPVSYQDYENEEQEYADIVSDNAIASWSDIDLSWVNKELENMGPEFDIDLFGIKHFNLDPVVDLSDSFEPEEKQDQFIIEVTFPNDMEMRDVVDDLSHRGYVVRVKGE